ncbi:MAG: CpaD family pilus assembly lipoprotein, partial [Stenotrophomonas sp.]
MTHDVIIAGAGPVGLLLACELRLGGVSVLVLEREPDPYAALKRLPFGMRGLSVPSIEALDRRGLLDALAALQPPRDHPAAGHWTGQQRRPAGHFAGIQYYQDRVDTGRWPYRMPGAVATAMMVDMQSLETVLAERATGLGVTILRGAGVDAVSASSEGVTVNVGNERFDGRWLVGCDGGRSTVRRATGIAFVGTEPEFTGYSLDVVLTDPPPLPPGRHYTATGMYTFAAPGTIGMVAFDGGAHHRQPLTREHVQNVLRHVSCTDVSVSELRLATTWTDRACQAATYRSGRVLLAGDAAHVHSPLGGQGLNLGLGDAMNLGWKLAATIRGAAADGLLDSYTRERHPIVLRDAPRSLDVFVGRSGSTLDARQAEDVASFAREFRRSGKGGLVAEVPTGDRRDRAAYDTLNGIRAALSRGGVSPGILSVRSYPVQDPGLTSPIRLTF